MKLFNLIFSILFVVCAGLQYNDPDPYLWMPIYLFGAVLCWFAFRGEYYGSAMLVGVGCYLFYAIFLFFTRDGVEDWISKHNAENIAATMKATRPWIEETREFFGLCILMAVLLIDYFYARKRQLLKTS
ncbi:MAG: transmembrane 220 family protein [Chitinophagaceae bacterium]|nr:transmembrane 220 family protein [Chitinophagaceae bacterium]